MVAHTPHDTRSRSEVTLERIMGAAKDEFAQNGFAGARVDGIARRAGVNKAALYYHVGDKKTLYARVIQHVLQGASSRLEHHLVQSRSPEERILAYVRALAETFCENPQMPRIVMREMVSGGQTLPGVFFDGLARIIGMLADIIDDGRRSGVFGDARAGLVHFMTIGALVISTTAVPLMRERCTGDGFSKVFFEPRTVEELAGEIGNMVLRLLEARGEHGRRNA